MRRFATAVALLALALPTFAQQQPFEEQVEVNAVLLDVIVTDASGNQILGLGKDDFVVKENGVVQQIDSVDYFTNRMLLDAREEKAPFQVERVHEDRYFIFFFDKPSDPGVLRDQLTVARNAVRDFVRNDMKETDRVAIIGHDIRLKIYSDFTNDPKQLERALIDATRFGRGLTGGGAAEGPSILRNLDERELIRDTGSVYEAIDLLADALAPIRARKNLVLLSPGIADRYETIRGGMIVDRSHHVDPMLASLNSANVSVYGVQLQRDVESVPMYHQRLSEIADATGGRYFQFTANFRPAIDAIDDFNSGYYLLTYRSKHPKGESGFQKVDVSVKSPELRVTARAGYQYGG